MNIKARINARKIIITYFYEKIIFSQLAQKESILSEILAIDNQFNFQKELHEEKALFSEMIKTYYTNFDDHIDYLIQQFFTSGVEDGIDMDYIQKTGPLFEKYLPIAQEVVNTYTTSFEFDRMDTIDQCVFILGVVEYHVFKTPKEILINEMVELAKRYGDGGTSKLVNAILHKIISHQQELEKLGQTKTSDSISVSPSPKKTSKSVVKSPKKSKLEKIPSLFDGDMK